ncbi:MAG TPA: SurA N-terminal domain-containing protein [Sporichthya sp.]|nr:SurA N-terminal domain-containing protein [Sporichthya sp.]
MKHRRTAARVALPVAVVLALGGLSGCRTSQLGAAAIVDGQRITVSEVQATLEDVSDQRRRLGMDPELGPEAARVEVERRVLDLVFERAAVDLGIVVTAADVAATRAAEERSDEEIAQLAAQNNVSVDALDDLYRRFTIERRITDQIDKQFPGADEKKLNDEFSDRLVRTAREMEIRINPRYGTFDPTVGQIAPLKADYLQPPAHHGENRTNTQ